MGVVVYCGLGFDGVYGSMELGLFPDVPEFRSDEGGDHGREEAPCFLEEALVEGFRGLGFIVV